MIEEMIDMEAETIEETTEEEVMMKDLEALETVITAKKKVILLKIALILDKKEEIIDLAEVEVDLFYNYNRRKT